MPGQAGRGERHEEGKKREGRKRERGREEGRRGKEGEEKEGGGKRERGREIFIFYLYWDSRSPVVTSLDIVEFIEERRCASFECDCVQV